jgi:hypothetical protein
MRKILLLVLLLLAAFYTFHQKFIVQTGHSQNDSFQLVLVEKSTGKLIHIIGGE